MARQFGNLGKVRLPIGSGILVTNDALAPDATKKVGGVLPPHPILLSGYKYINKKAITPAGTAPFSFQIQGIVGSANGLTPGSGNNKIAAAAFSYYKDNSTPGTPLTSTAGDVTVTRPASAHKCINAIVITMATGVVSAVVGTDGDAFSDVLGADGGPPLVAVDEIVIGYWYGDSNTAAPVVASEIQLFNLAGTLIQERGDVAYEESFLEGGILPKVELLKCHTGAVARIAYGTFYSMQGMLADIGDSEGWNFDQTTPIGKMPAQGDLATVVDQSGPREYKGGVNKFRTNGAMFELCQQSNYGIIQLYPDRNVTTDYYEGMAFFSGEKEDSSVGKAMKSDFTFEIDGILEHRIA